MSQYGPVPPFYPNFIKTTSLLQWLDRKTSLPGKLVLICFDFRGSVLLAVVSNRCMRVAEQHTYGYLAR